jgi:hypothetical protein
MSPSFLMTAAWGLVIIAAFVGWGGAIGQWLFPERQIDLGLRSVWGMALVILVGGVAALFSLATGGMLLTFVALGCGLALVHALRGPRPDLTAAAARWKEHPATSLLLVVCAAIALVQYLGSISNMGFNPNDDYVAYFPFARQIVQQGTLFDPFSTRRVMSFGGHSMLHAVVLAGSSAFRLHMLDQGICLLMAVLLVTGAQTSTRSRWPMLLALALILTLPNIRINTYAQMSGVVIFLGLYRTMTWLDEREGTQKPVANAAIIALLATGACTLRSNYIAVSVPMVALSYAFLVWKGGADRGRWMRETLYTVAFSVAFLAPWMIMSYGSSGTPLFPLLRGHFNDAFPMMQSATNWQRQVSDLVATVSRNRLFGTFPLLFVAGLLLPDRGPRKPLHTLLVSIAIGWVALVHTLASDIPSFERYVYGFIVAGGVAVTMRLAIMGDVTSVVHRSARVLAVVAALLQLAFVSSITTASHQNVLRHLALTARMPVGSPELMRVTPSYRTVQSRIRPGEPLLVMADYPFLFNFARNPIYNIDTAAAVSPPPGFPYFRGPDAVGDYLRGQSIRYLAYVPTQSAISLYRREFWQSQLGDPNAFWHTQAPVYLDLFDNIEQLAATHVHLHDDADLVLLDLGQKR